MSEHTNRRGGSKRRKFLKTTGTLAVASAFAGCSGDGGSGGSGSDGGSGDGGGSGSGGGSGGTTESGLPTFENEAGVEVGETWEAVQELAAEEGELSVYATIDRGPFSEWMDAFKEAHPDVSVNHVTGGSEKLGSRWFTEYNTDNVSASMYVGSTGIARTWQEGTTLELDGEMMPSYGEMDSRFKGDNGMWVGVRQVLGNIFVNTDMWDPDKYGSWMDVVTDSDLQGGQFAHDPTPNMVLMQWLLSNVGREYFEDMESLEPRWVDSHTDLARLCGAGEYPVCFTYTHKMGRFGNQLPLEHLMFDQTPSQVSPFVINNKAPRPNSAIVFGNWLASVEGQNAIGNTQYIPVNPDAEYSGYPGVMPPKNGEISILSPEKSKKEAEEMWQEVMGDQLGTN